MSSHPTPTATTPDPAAGNKQRMQHIMAALATGDGRPFADCMAEDFRRIIPGSTPWSRSYDGKQVVLDELIRPLFAQFADRYTNTAQRIVAEGDIVVVECRGKVTTRQGKPYHNRYCLVCRFADGRLQELTEYMDTDLLNTALQPPAATAP